MRTQVDPLALHDRRALPSSETGGGGSPSSTCFVAGCPHPTSEQKPYCAEHLDRLPYVKRLKAELSRRDAETVAAVDRRRQGDLDPNGVRANEILDELALHGPQTFERLGLTLGMPARAVEGYVRVLERSNVVETLMVGRRRGVRRIAAHPSPTERILAQGA